MLSLGLPLVSTVAADTGGAATLTLGGSVLTLQGRRLTLPK